MEPLQDHINKDVQEDIKKLYDHAKIANEEMGQVHIRLSEIETTSKWTMKMIEKVDTRTWIILSVIILGILINIYEAVK